MADKPAEILLFDFLKEKIDASDVDSTIYGLQLHDTVWQTITERRGVRISDAVGQLSRNAGGELDEFDVELILACFSKIDSENIKDRQPALVDAFAIQQAVHDLLETNSTLGGRVCDLLIRKSGRGYDKYDEGVFAVVNIPLVINPRELGR